MNKAPDMCLKCAYLSILDCPEGARLGCFNSHRIETFQNDVAPPCEGQEGKQEDTGRYPWNVCGTCRWYTERITGSLMTLDYHRGCAALKKVLEHGSPCPCKGGSYERE